MTTKTDVFVFRLHALAEQAQRISYALDRLAEAPFAPDENVDREIRCIEDSLDVIERLRIRDIKPKLTVAA